MGMIFLNNEDLPIQSIVKKWLSRVQDAKLIETFMENYFYSALEIVLQYEQHYAVDTTRLGIVRNALSLI